MENFTRNDDAVATGWYGQAATLLEDDTESAEYGLLLIVSGYTVLMGGNIDAGRELLEQARDVGRRVGDQDVEGLASIYLGHALVTSGDQAAGLAMVDEATAAAMSGRLGIQAAGTIYCSTIFLCRNIGDWRRAGEWTDDVDAVVPARIGQRVPRTVPVPSRRDHAVPRGARGRRGRRARRRRRAHGLGAPVGGVRVSRAGRGAETTR